MLNINDIAQLEERRQATGIADIAAEAVPLAGGFLCYTAPGSWSNQACGLAMDRAITDDELDALVDFYVQRGSVPQLEVCPYAHPSLVAGLGARGFVVREFEHVMVRSLPAGEDLDALVGRGGLDGLTLTHLEPSDAETARAHIEVATSGFGGVDEAGLALNMRMLRHRRVDGATARVGEDVVGASSVETFGELGCLLSTTVLSEWRRRGVQAALMIARMRLTRGRGARVVCVHCEPGIATERNALRLGFSVAYTKVVMHRPGPGLAPSR